MADPGETPTTLPCHRCGYDLRAHTQDSRCPECGSPAEESWRIAAIPRRPTWRDADPRWRRRMLAGTWLLVFLPLMDALKSFGWASRIPAPCIFGYDGVHTLDQTFLSFWGVYRSLLFCMGTVLLFSKEHGRRRNASGWTRRWGVICTYVVLLLSAASVLFIAALVLAGIAALFQTMPPKYQPRLTQLFVQLAFGYLRYGPQPSDLVSIVLVAFSSITILLACNSLYDAFRSIGAKYFAAISLAPLALISLVYLVQGGRYYHGGSGITPKEISQHETFFGPETTLENIALLKNPDERLPWFFSSYGVEALKWCCVLAIALRLSIAQIATPRPSKRPAHSQSTASST